MTGRPLARTADSKMARRGPVAAASRVPAFAGRRGAGGKDKLAQDVWRVRHAGIRPNGGYAVGAGSPKISFSATPAMARG